MTSYDRRRQEWQEALRESGELRRMGRRQRAMLERGSLAVLRDARLRGLTRSDRAWRLVGRLAWVVGCVAVLALLLEQLAPPAIRGFWPGLLPALGSVGVAAALATLGRLVARPRIAARIRFYRTLEVSRPRRERSAA